MKKNLFIIVLAVIGTLTLTGCSNRSDEKRHDSDRNTETVIQEELMAVDLGLPSGTKWANMNVGAHSPEESGCYYAWGEIEEKDVYNDVTYKFVTGEDTDSDGFYDMDKKYIELDKNICGTNNDVAHVKWGGNWQMPSLEQIQELLDKCTSHPTTSRLIDGRIFIGPNGNSIFLPATGYKYGSKVYFLHTVGDYWSGSLHNSEQ